MSERIPPDDRDDRDDRDGPGVAPLLAACLLCGGAGALSALLGGAGWLAALAAYWAAGTGGTLLAALLVAGLAPPLPRPSAPRAPAVASALAPALAGGRGARR